MGYQPRAIRACILALSAAFAGCDNTGTILRPQGTGAGTVLSWTGGGPPQVGDSGVTLELNNVVFGGADVVDAGGGLFVAVGESGVILTSADGVSWTQQSSPSLLDLYGITYSADLFDGGGFIAVGGNDVAAAGVVLRGTPDGVTWTVEDVSSTLAAPLTGVTYANGEFVAVGGSQVLTSTDGTAWSALSPAPTGITGPTVDLYNTAFGDGLFVTVGTYNTSTSSSEIAYDGLIATSKDGTTWSVLPYTPNYLSGVTYGGGQFVAVGREGSILTSADGTAWAEEVVSGLDMTETPYLISVLYAGGQYVATGNYVGVNPSTGFLLRSADAKAWTVTPVGPNLYAVAYGVVDGVGTFVAVGGE